MRDIRRLDKMIDELAQGSGHAEDFARLVTTAWEHSRAGSFAVPKTQNWPLKGVMASPSF